jgi:hypothetical protein
MLLLVGSRYAAPARGKLALPFRPAAGNAELQFGYGTAPAVATKAGTLLPDRFTVAAPGVSNVKLDLTRGMFSGTFMNAGKRSSFSGVLFQRQGNGRGLLMGAGAPGWVSLEARAPRVTAP